MHRIVFLDRATIAPQITLRAPRFAHELITHDHTRPDEVVARLAGASVAIINKVTLRADALERLPDLKLIAVAATGTDCVDKAYCEAKGIAVANIRGYAIHTVPEHTFALILALRRNVVAYRNDVLSGRWQASGQFCFFDHPIHDLAGARLGIIGEGVLGQRVAEAVLELTAAGIVLVIDHFGQDPGFLCPFKAISLRVVGQHELDGRGKRFIGAGINNRLQIAAAAGNQDREIEFFIRHF